MYIYTIVNNIDLRLYNIFMFIIYIFINKIDGKKLYLLI